MVTPARTGEERDCDEDDEEHRDGEEDVRHGRDLSRVGDGEMVIARGRGEQ